MISEKKLRIVALGNRDRGDDGAALQVADRFHGRVAVALAGQPGPGLLDLMLPSEVCVLLDVTVSGAPPGTIHRIPLSDLSPESLPDARISSHGFGPGEALALARALGREIPRGLFLGIEGREFGSGQALSPAVLGSLDPLEGMVWEFLEEQGFGSSA